MLHLRRDGLSAKSIRCGGRSTARRWSTRAWRFWPNVAEQADRPEPGIACNARSAERAWSG